MSHLLGLTGKVRTIRSWLCVGSPTLSRFLICKLCDHESNHTDSFGCAVYEQLCIPKDQLRRFLVASAHGPEVWTEERSDERKLEEIEDRQLDYWYGKWTPGRRLETRR